MCFGFFVCLVWFFVQWFLLFVGFFFKDSSRCTEICFLFCSYVDALGFFFFDSFVSLGQTFSFKTCISESMVE